MKTEAKTVLLKYCYSYDEERSTRPAVEINAMMVKLKFVWLSHTFDETSRYIDKHGAAIMLSMKSDVGTGLQASVFCRLAESTTEPGLENEIVCDMKENKRI